MTRAFIHYERHRPALITLYRLVRWHAASYIAHTEVRTGAVLPRVIQRTDTPTEVDYCKHGGILRFVLRRMLAA